MLDHNYVNVLVRFAVHIVIVWQGWVKCVHMLQQYLETSTRLNEKPTCTQQQCQWVIPAYQKNIPYARVHDLDFTSPKGKIDTALDTLPPPSKATTHKSVSVGISPPTEAELSKFYKSLSDCGTKPGILSVVLPYAKGYAPRSSLRSIPTPLPELYQQKYRISSIRGRGY